jgi:hypothetical protein
VTEPSEWEFNIYEVAGTVTHNDNEGLREATLPNAEFWYSRPELKSIYENSRRTMIAPWSALGLAICRSLVSIPYWVHYESFMGTASLNIGVVNVGDSGGGKSRLAGLVDASLPFLGFQVPKFTMIEVGSGEAIPDAYAHTAEKDDPQSNIMRGDLVWHNISHARLFSFDEVGRMFKMGSRDSGSTIFEYVKQGLSGGPLGRVLAKGGGTLLNPQEYRFAFTTNAQPSRSAVLLNEDEIEGGFPGRLLWFETRDPRAVTERDDSPIEPYGIKDIDWRLVGAIRGLPQMDAAHRRDRELYHTDQRDPIDGHLNLVKAKVAVALMRLNGRTYLNDEDWELAGVVLEESVRVRKWVQQVLAMKGREAEKARGESLARQTVAAETAKETLTLSRIVGLLRSFEAKGMPQNMWRRNLSSRDREFYEEALASLVGKT